MEKKYRLTDETINVNGKTLHRIEALRDFTNVRVGDKGGFIEGESNLSHDGACWVSDNARVYGNARVYDDARVSDNARGSGNAEVLWISKIGSRLGTTTVYRNSESGISVCCGCFQGTLEQFEERVKKTHGDLKYGREYAAFIELVKIHFEV